MPTNTARYSPGSTEVVPLVGFEPTRPFGQSILSAPRLPFRHSGAQQHMNNTVESTLVNDQDTNSTAPRRVVVAEDESLIRLDIVEILRDNGFEVVGEAGDGETAVALATELRPDLVVMDVKMPQLDGISAAERLSKDHIAPVVLLTAFSQKELVERASEAGALAYVVKPFTPNDLLPAIEIALARYQQIIALEAEVTDMVQRFETRKLVDRAKGLLNEKMGLTEPEAFRWIQKASMDRRLTMHDVSQAIIEQLAPKK